MTQATITTSPQTSMADPSMLLFDCGNTRVKWAWVKNLDIHEKGAFDYTQLEVQLDGLGQRFGASLDRLGLSQVNSTTITTRFLELSQQIGKPLTIAKVVSPWQMGCDQLTCQYALPQLGVDRWLGVLASWQLLKTQCGHGNRPLKALVVNMGTATTIDGLVNHSHRGGMIIAGAQTMINALAQGTALLPELDLTKYFANQTRSELKNLDAVPITTQTAILKGALWSQMASIEKCCQQEMYDDHHDHYLFVTGGASQFVIPYLQESQVLRQHRVHLWIEPDLVLLGLAYYCSQPRKR